MSRVDRYLPYAFEAIKKVAVGEDKFSKDGHSILKVYKGYISSLGASIIQAGLKTAVYFYEAKEKSGEGNKQLVSAAINYILEKDSGNTDPTPEGRLSQRLAAGADYEKLSIQVMDAATALKLALRTYKMD